MYAIGGIVVALILVLVGSSLNIATPTVGSVSTSGTYNNAVSWSSITLAPTTATSTSILNTGSDRAIIATFDYCIGITSSYTFGTGTGLTSNGWTLHIATSTLANSTLDNNPVYLFNGFIATTTGYSYVASSTGSIPTSSAFASSGNWNMLWPSNSYLNFSLNATNTASCSFGVQWLPQ